MISGSVPYLSRQSPMSVQTYARRRPVGGAWVRTAIPQSSLIWGLDGGERLRQKRGIFAAGGAAIAALTLAGLNVVRRCILGKAGSLHHSALASAFSPDILTGLLLLYLCIAALAAA